MKLCRFQPLEFAATNIARASHESHPHVRHGIIEANWVHEFSGELWGAPELTGQNCPPTPLKFCPPPSHGKLFGGGRISLAHPPEWAALRQRIPKFSSSPLRRSSRPKNPSS